MSSIPFYAKLSDLKEADKAQMIARLYGLEAKLMGVNSEIIKVVGSRPDIRQFLEAVGYPYMMP